MNQDLIYAPMGAMALLTFSVLLLVLIARFRAVFAARVAPDDFKLGESPSVPAAVSLPNRNYMNLLELPTLVFPVCLMFHLAHRVDGFVLGVSGLGLCRPARRSQPDTRRLQQCSAPPHRLHDEQRCAWRAVADVLPDRAT
jgi:hypothetical protein